jgi:4-hydroxy-2-oxoheptanedioate aldolase
VEAPRNRVKRVIEEGGVALAGLVGTFRGPTMPELIGLAGYDAALIDMEHGGFDLGDVQELILASEIAGVMPMVRIPGFDRHLIMRLLDIGAQGIQLSGVSSVAEAQELVDAVRFPPVGTRGLIGNSRALRYGGVSSAAYMAEAERNVLVKITIEDLEGLEAVEDIAGVDGIDLIGAGPHDLSAALGVVGQPDAPVLVEAMERIVRAANAGGRRRLSQSVGHAAYPRTPAQLAAAGVAFITCQPFAERRLLQSFTEQVQWMRSALLEEPEGA